MFMGRQRPEARGVNQERRGERSTQEVKVKEGEVGKEGGEEQEEGDKQEVEDDDIVINEVCESEAEVNSGDEGEGDKDQNENEDGKTEKRSYKTKAQKMSEEEEEKRMKMEKYEKAGDDFKRGKFKNIRQAAKAYGLNYQTLYYGLVNNGGEFKGSGQHTSKLTLQEEMRVVEHIKWRASVGYGLDWPMLHSATITMKYLDPPGRPQTQWQMLTGYHRNHNS